MKYKSESFHDSNYSSCIMKHVFDDGGNYIRTKYIARIYIADTDKKDKYIYFGTYDSEEQAKKVIDDYKQFNTKPAVHSYQHSEYYNSNVKDKENIRNDKNLILIAINKRIKLEQQKLIKLLENPESDISSDSINKILNNINELKNIKI